MRESEEGVNPGKRMEGSLEEEKPAGESGDGGKIERNHSINLNSLPAITAAAAATRENDDLHGAVESGDEDSSTGKGEESSGTVQKKFPKNEKVNEGEVQGYADVKTNSVDPLNSENPVEEKDALVNVAENGGCADGGHGAKRVKVLSVVNKDESGEEDGDSINSVTVAGYREEKGATGSSAGTTVVRAAGTRSSSFHGVTRHRWSGKFEAHLWDSSCRIEGRRRKGKQVAYVRKVAICFSVDFGEGGVHQDQDEYLDLFQDIAFLQKNHRSHFLWNKPAAIHCILWYVLRVRLCTHTCQINSIEEESSPAFEEEFIEGADR